MAQSNPATEVTHFWVAQPGFVKTSQSCLALDQSYCSVKIQLLFNPSMVQKKTYEYGFGVKNDPNIRYQLYLQKIQEVSWKYHYVSLC